MRILSLSTYNTPCGIGDMNIALQRAMHAAGNDYDISPITQDMRDARPGCFKAFFDSLKNYDGAVVQHEHGFFGPNERQSMKNFFHFLEKFKSTGKPCIAVFHTNFHSSPKKKALKQLSGYFSSRQVWRRKLLRAMNKNPKLAFFVHGTASQRSLRDFGVKAERVIKIHLPMKEVDNLPTKIWNDAEVNLGIFGFIAGYKGYRVALESLMYLPSNFKLVIAGGKHPYNQNDHTLENIYKLIETGHWYGEKLGDNFFKGSDLKNRVRITGFIPDINKVFSDIDIVLAPYTELFPAGSAALSDSLSRGKPIIASATPSFSEIYEDGKAVKLVAMHAPFELAVAIKELAENKAERDRLSQSALLFAKQNSWRNCAELFANTLANLAGEDALRNQSGAWKSHPAPS